MQFIRDTIVKAACEDQVRQAFESGLAACRKACEAEKPTLEQLLQTMPLTFQEETRLVAASSPRVAQVAEALQKACADAAAVMQTLPQAERRIFLARKAERQEQRQQAILAEQQAAALRNAEEERIRLHEERTRVVYAEAKKLYKDFKDMTPAQRARQSDFAYYQSLLTQLTAAQRERIAREVEQDERDAAISRERQAVFGASALERAAALRETYPELRRARRGSLEAAVALDKPYTFGGRTYAV
jgi:hypothetical protein